MYIKTEAITDKSEVASWPCLLTVAQAAQVGGWSQKFIRDLLARGELKGCKLGHSWRVDRDALIAQLGL